MSVDAHPVIAAIVRGDHEAVREAGKSVTALSDPKGKAALAVAADLGHAAVVEALLDAGASDAVPSSGGWSAAMLASFRGHAEVLSLLLAQPGACPAAADACGITALHAAAMKGRVAAAELLLDAAPEGVNTTDVLGRTPLMLAATAGSVDTLHLLAGRGAALDQTADDGKTALHWAVIAHRPRAVEALLKLGCSTDKVDLPSTDPMPRPHGSAKDPNAGKTAAEYAETRLGKDPVLVRTHKYLLSSRARERRRRARRPTSRRCLG